jgi:hypothetical protein
MCKWTGVGGESTGRKIKSESPVLLKPTAVNIKAGLPTQFPVRYVFQTTKR